MATFYDSGPLKVGDWVKILNSGYTKPSKIVEYRGPLGPRGVRIFRVKLRGKPYPAYGEFREDQLEVVVKNATPMSKRLLVAEVKTDAPAYLGWRGEMLAQLTFARVPALAVYKKENGGPPTAFDFALTTEWGLCFFVVVRAFSSIKPRLRDVEHIAELRCPLEPEVVRLARMWPNPVFLFLFDADTDHGRCLRIDTLPEPRGSRVVVSLPISATITKESIEELVRELEAARCA